MFFWLNEKKHEIQINWLKSSLFARHASIVEKDHDADGDHLLWTQPQDLFNTYLPCSRSAALVILKMICHL